MNGECVSARQLSVAMLVGGLSHAAAFGGAIDWRWALAAMPVGVLLHRLFLHRVGKRQLFFGVAGRVLAALYGGWAVVLMSAVLHRSAQRLAITNADRGDGMWILLLILLPLLWIGCQKSAAFFRAVEIFWLAAVALLAGVLLFAIPRMEWRWLILPVGDWRVSLPPLVLVHSVGLFLLPYIYKVEDGLHRGKVWQGGLGLLAAALAAVTAGLLSPAVAGQIQKPFFVASGVLGQTVRAEGLISALWLLPDLALTGLLSRVWGGKHRAAFAAALAGGLALTGLPNYFSVKFLALGTLILAALTLLFPAGKGK